MTPTDVSAREQTPDEVRCTLCGGAPEHHNPLVPDDYAPDVQLHLHCLNSPAGRAWTDTRAAADPGYARYLQLMTVQQPLQCPSCGKTAHVSPKAYGMSAGHWELNCTRCAQHRPLLNGHCSTREREALLRLHELAVRFRLGNDTPAVLAEVDSLGNVMSDVAHCACGGEFTLTARPRCGRCGEPVLDSPFHVTTVVNDA